MIDEQIEFTKKSINDSENIDKKTFEFVEIEIRRHFDTPQFWAIQIDNNDIFWGYFMLNKTNDSEFFQGTKNNCFHFNDTDSRLDGFSDWINNIFERLDKWTQIDNKKKINNGSKLKNAYEKFQEIFH